MHILSEKEIEDILVLHPELIEEGLTLIDRQAQLETRRTDLSFIDRNQKLLLVELKKSVVTHDDLNQIKDYVSRLTKTIKKELRAMLIGSFVPEEIKTQCKKDNVEWKEITNEMLYNHLQQNNRDVYESIFMDGRLHVEAKSVTKFSFQDYLNATSPFGVPYTSYQFFKPIDASPELSDDNKANQLVADQFIKILINLPFNRTLFNQRVDISRNMGIAPIWSSTAGGAWQGNILSYTLISDDYPKGIPCEIYVGTIGYRGNKSTFADEKSRFIVTRIGTGSKQITTQYGLHKYIRTEKKALLPFYELKFNAVGLPKKYWEDIYNILSGSGYIVKDSSDKKPAKMLWIGDINLSDVNVKEKVGNLIEALFAVTIVKAHFRGKEKGIEFDFLRG